MRQLCLEAKRLAEGGQMKNLWVLAAVVLVAGCGVDP